MVVSGFCTWWVKLVTNSSENFEMTDKNNELPSVNDKDWIFYKDREEWADVEPVPQNDGEYPVVSISYTDRCEKLTLIIY